MIPVYMKTSTSYLFLLFISISTLQSQNLIPNFTSSQDTICAGDSITFTNTSNSTGGAIANDWNWTFENGIPATANTQGPHTVFFPNSGTQNINLSISDGTTTADTTFQVFIDTTLSISEIHTNPSACLVSDGSITLAGFIANQDYTITYDFNGATQTASSFIANAAGEIIITNLDAGDYYNFIIAATTSSSSFGANLVPNPSFENVTCLTSFNAPPFIPTNTYAASWVGANTASPDIFHSCNTGSFGNFSTPNNFQGNQTPFVGNGYAGLITYENFATEFKEYIQAPLNSPLVAGQTYTIGFYASLSEFSEFVSDGLAMFISSGGTTFQTNQNVIVATPQLVAPVINSASLWTLVQGTYTATGGEDNLKLGNFFTDANTTVAPSGFAFNTFNRANYYVDSVFIIPISSSSSPICYNLAFDTISLSNTFPTIMLDVDTTICLGNSISLTATNPDAAIISWNNGISDGTAFNPTNTATYTVSADLNSCFSYDTIIVAVINCDTLETIINFTADNICIGDSITFTDASSGTLTSWNWTFSGGNIANENTQGPHTISFDTAGVFDISLTISDGNIAGDTTIQITVNSLPIINAGIDTSVCIGENLSLTASNPDGANISWNNGISDGLSFTVLNMTTFVATATLNTCVNTDSIEVFALDCDTITAQILNSADTICIGETISFTDLSFGTPNTWNWTFNGGNISTASTQGAHSIIFDTPGDFDIVLSVSDGNYSDDTTIQITVNALPSINAGADTSICQGASLSLIAQNPDAAAISWNNGVLDGVSFSPTNTTSYIVTASLNGCTNTDTATVNLNTSNTTNINNTLCAGANYSLPSGTVVSAPGVYPDTISGFNSCDSIIITTLTPGQIGSFDTLQNESRCASFSLVLDANTANMNTVEWFVDDGLGFVSLAGNPNYVGANTDVLTILLDTSLNQNRYRITMTDNCGNTSSTEMFLEVFSPTALQNTVNDTSFCAHEQNILTVPYIGQNFVWNTGETGRFITPTESGIYTVSFNEQNTNCLQEDEISVTITDCLADCKILLPTAFSPDGNGMNDKLKALSNCKEEITNFSFLLYNRWGEKLFETTDINFEWEGVHKNNTISADVYSYYMKYTIENNNETKTDKGTITVLK